MKKKKRKAIERPIEDRMIGGPKTKNRIKNKKRSWFDQLADEGEEMRGIKWR